MILFVCPEPTPENERDGLVQRVAAIDASFQDAVRTILSVSFTRNLRRRVVRRSETLTVERVNAFIHFLHILRLARRSLAVYVHTCNQALRVLPLYALLKNLVTDLHGALPEEIAMQGNRIAKFRYDLIEKFVVRRSSILICVTNAMKTHFIHKYPGVKAHFFLLAIIPTMAPPSTGQIRESDLALYCGGTQAWQCIPDLLMCIRKTSAFRRFLLLTGDIDKMRHQANLVGAIAEIFSVPKAMLPQYYARAAYGFVLRDDNVVNRVACPTKLIEYIYYGIVPVVKMAQIGDFYDLGYQYIKMEDFIAGDEIEFDRAEQMRRINRNILHQLLSQSQAELRRLKVQLGVFEAFPTEQPG